MAPLPPGSTIGILGGGQLGRMLALAAARLGLKVHIYNDATGPACDVAAATTLGAFDDTAKLEAFARAVRAHWAIENALHWVLDVTFDEDRARNRRDNGPENLAILRRLTLNLLNKARPRMSAARKRKRSGWSDAFARTIIGQMR